MRKIIHLFLCLIASIGFVVAQTIKVTGSVTSKEDGEPIMGASVIVKNQKTIGTITDIDRNFSIEVPQNAKTLLISEAVSAFNTASFFF